MPTNLTWFEKFIDKHYLKQDKWVRSIVFIIFSLVVAYSGYRIVGGNFALQGSLSSVYYKNGKPLTIRGHGYEVQVGDRSFESNSEGLFYLILNATAYAHVLATGGIEVTIFKNEAQISAPKLKYRYGPGADFESFPINEVEGDLGSSTDVLAASNTRFKFDKGFIGTARADIVIPQNDRLFVDEIQISADNELSAKEDVSATLNLSLGGQSFSLNTETSKETDTVYVPISPGTINDLGRKYYFSVPPQLSGTGHITITYQTNSFFSSPGGQDLNIRIPPDYAQEVSVSVLKRNSTNLASNYYVVSVQRMNPYDVVIFTKKDTTASRDGLIDSLKKKGYRVFEVQPVLGEDSQTNAIFSGKNVPISIVQAVIKATHDANIKLKTIQVGISLSSGNQYQIQIGSSTKYNKEPPIPDTKIEELLAVHDLQSFQSMVQ